jgi:hypothetical protein
MSAGDAYPMRTPIGVRQKKSSYFLSHRRSPVRARGPSVASRRSLARNLQAPMREFGEEEVPAERRSDTCNARIAGVAGWELWLR